MSNLVCEELAGNNLKVNLIMSNWVCEEVAGNNSKVKLIHVFMNLCLEFLKSGDSWGKEYFPHEVIRVG